MIHLINEMNLSCLALILFPNLSLIYNELLISGRLRLIILQEKIENKPLHGKQVFGFNSWGILGDLQPQKETLSSLPFVPGDGSKAAIYCSSIYPNPNGTIVSVHSDVTNTVNTRIRRNLRSDRKRRSKSDMAAVPGPHCSSALRVFRTGNEQLVPAGPGELSTSLFEGSDSVDI